MAGALVLALAGCGKDQVRSRLSAPPSKGWRGTYLTAPSEFAAAKGHRFAELAFRKGNHAQLSATVRHFEAYTWATTLRISATDAMTAEAQCVSTAIFHHATPQSIAKLVYSKRVGQEARYVGEADRDELKRFQSESGPLAKLIPAAFLSCEDTKINFKRLVLPGGELEIQMSQGDRMWKFGSALSPRFVDTVDALSSPTPNLNLWQPQGTVPGLEGTFVVEDAKNSYLPAAPQTHRFYLLPKTSLKEGDTFWDPVLRRVFFSWSRNPRADLKGQKAITTQPSFLQLELGKWISPRLEKARLLPVSKAVIEASHYRTQSELKGEIAFNETDLSTAEGKFILHFGFSVQGETGTKLWSQQEITLAGNKITSVKSPTFEWKD